MLALNTLFVEGFSDIVGTAFLNIPELNAIWSAFARSTAPQTVEDALDSPFS